MYYSGTSHLEATSAGGNKFPSFLNFFSDEGLLKKVAQLHLRHSRRESSGNGRTISGSLLVVEKVPVRKDSYYSNVQPVFKNANGSHKCGHRMSLSYVASAKGRFRFRSKEDCRICHDALTNTPLEVLRVL
ncbi:hypothetical protein HAX54_011667 [Datura stramonium]|uniref:Uncharacterized protein n=1 Tax=Datura stramonium TaxID=4076 RepID=A0ABS8Y3N3_DATST|nr:hypothetical protein [Datura stramonium]